MTERDKDMKDATSLHMSYVQSQLLRILIVLSLVLSLVVVSLEVSNDGDRWLTVQTRMKLWTPMVYFSRSSEVSRASPINYERDMLFTVRGELLMYYCMLF